MEFVNANDDNSFDPTPKLKSSPIPITFISFNECDVDCYNCGEKYVKTKLCNQKYCKKCLLHYITNITDNNNIYLDVYLCSTRDTDCTEHKLSSIKKPQIIQECCRNCLEISCFKQISACGIRSFSDNNDDLLNNILESEKHCKLCGKLLCDKQDDEPKLCSNCYQVSSGYVESSLLKKPIRIIYLPFWYDYCWCKDYNIRFTFTSDCQKYCRDCCTFFIGCRYCLTTNVIFGPTNQTQCKKCKRVTKIIFDVASIKFSGNSVLDDFLLNSRINFYDNLKVDEFISKKTKKEYFIPCNLVSSINNKYIDIMVEWIPYSQFENVKKIAEGGFGIIYKANWLDGSLYSSGDFNIRRKNEEVILKRFKDSRDISKDFLNELKSNHNCYEYKHHVIRVYGFTKDPEFNNYILVMQYASGGDLHNYLRENFTTIPWNKNDENKVKRCNKLTILQQISEGLKTIHKAKFIHRDFHSGNILLFLKLYQWKIGDLGLSQPTNTTSSNDEIYGVIPYIAPEVFKGSEFSEKTDIYCMGMIMWELTSGCKPFADVEHDIHLVYKILDGERPEITEDTPECYANLMKSCWDPDPKKRPSINEIFKNVREWSTKNNNKEEFDKAEIKRKKLIESKKLGPKFAKEPHSKASYTSRPLSAFISECSTINMFPKDYTSIEMDLDIDTERPLIAACLGKRNFEVSEIEESHDNSGKHIKPNFE